MKIQSLLSLRKWIIYFLGKKISQRLSDKMFVQLEFYAHMGYALPLSNPQTYNEKIQWLKLYDHKPEYTKLVDKHEVKTIVAQIIGDEYIIPELGVWDNPEDIDFDSLPERFVLKVTHDSGGLVICTDKDSFDKNMAIEKLTKSLQRDYFLLHREWPYKNVKRRIIAESYMHDAKTGELRDYKFFCFNGAVKLMFVATNRQDKNTETCFDFFDRDYNHLDIINGHPNAKEIPEQPISLHKMISLAEKLSQGIPHVRVDFYEVDGKPYFGEMTFSHWSGIVPFEPHSIDLEMGKWIQLPEKYM